MFDALNESADSVQHKIIFNFVFDAYLKIKIEIKIDQIFYLNCFLFLNCNFRYIFFIFKHLWKLFLNFCLQLTSIVDTQTKVGGCLIIFNKLMLKIKKKHKLFLSIFLSLSTCKVFFPIIFIKNICATLFFVHSESSSIFQE